MDSERRKFSIGEMCEAFGVTARALRFYEDEQLIAPERRGTARLYLDRDRARLTWILRGKRVGFSLQDIREMLDLYDVGDQRETQRRVTIERCRDRIAAMRRQRVDIDATIHDLENFVAQLGGDPQEGTA
ncbi:MAG: MerR family DNA-binding transcriptional regulator [Sphingomicrobium sp.]